MDQLPDAVLDYRLTTRRSADRRLVTHIIHDPDLPPSTPPRPEQWERDREPIGEGGQGRVYLQRCTSGARHYNLRAVKIIRYQDDHGKHRYLRELETMIRFSHRNYSKFFVRTLGWYLTSRTLCIAMEYLPEGDLHSYLRQNPMLSEMDAQQVISQVLQGLAIMHRVNIAHRDIKPQNILIQQLPTSTDDNSWWVKLADFGISKRTGSAVTTVTEAIGTFDYMAPEILSQDKDTPAIDHKAADIWALGATTFYLMTKSRSYLTWRSAYNVTPLIDNIFPDGCEISPRGRAFVLQLMLRDPKERPKCHEATLHAWVERFIPSDFQEGPDTQIHSPSTSSSSRSSFSNDEEITTLATRLTDTLLSPRRSPLNAEEEDTRLAPDKTAVLQKVDNESPDAGKNISIHEAARSGQIEIVKWHVKNGTSLEAVDDHQFTALICAASDGQTEVARFLLDQGAKIDARDTKQVAPLHAAAYYGHTGTVKLLLSFGADAGSIDTIGRTPLHNAASNGHLEIVKMLVDKGAKLELQDIYGRTPLYHAATDEAVEVIQFLAKRGASTTTADIEGNAPCHRPASLGHIKAVKQLLDLGVDVDFPGDKNRTCLDFAAAEGKLEMVKFLLDKGAKLNHISSSGGTPLFAAAMFGHLETAKLLANLGADIDHANSINHTPLLMAVANGHADVVEMLADRGANVNHIGDSQRSAIYVASFRGYPEVVKVLAKAGADLFKASKPGHTPLEVAISFGKTEVAQLLHDLMASSWIKSEFPSLSTSIIYRPKAPIPPQLKHHESFIRSKNYLGTDTNEKLLFFDISEKTDARRLTLYQGENRDYGKYSQGGNILNTLHDFVKIEALPGHPAAARVLRAGLMDDEKTLCFRFTMDEEFNKGEDPETAEDQSKSGEYEWRLEEGDPGLRFAHKFRLYHLKNPKSDSKDNPGKGIATAQMPAPFVALFEVHMAKALDDHMAVMVVMSAMLIWRRYHHGTATRSYIRKQLGYKDEFS